MSARLKFGTFTPPYHAVGTNPTLQLKRDLEIAVRLEEFGYDEVWYGEHHSGGWETIGAPDLMIASAAAQTKRIKLGTGVVSLPYHHPFMTAQRMTLLDHITEGRAIFGVGSGGLASDAQMLGFNAEIGRRRYDDALEAVLELLRSREAVDRHTDWYDLVEARVHLPAYSNPHIEVAVASTSSPTGPVLSGRHGLSLLSLGQWTPAGAESLGKSWALAADSAERSGTTVSRDNWRILGIAYVARSEREAREQCKNDLANVMRYLSTTAPFPPVTSNDADDIIDELNASGVAMIGGPNRAIERLQKLQEQTGGFGTFLIMNGDWVSHRDKVQMYETFAEYVFPHFQDQLPALQASYEYVARPADDGSGISWSKQALMDAKAATADLHAPTPAR